RICATSQCAAVSAAATFRAGNADLPGACACPGGRAKSHRGTRKQHRPFPGPGAINPHTPRAVRGPVPLVGHGWRDARPDQGPGPGDGPGPVEVYASGLYYTSREFAGGSPGAGTALPGLVDDRASL